jgi:hypothetical protein
VSLACDAGPDGIGAVLSHLIDGIGRPIAFVSWSRTPAERNYSQLDIEALAIVFAVDKFFTYLFNRHFWLVTDNKLILQIFHEKSLVPPMASARFSRYAAILYKIVHRRGTEISVLVPGFF